MARARAKLSRDTARLRAQSGVRRALAAVLALAAVVLLGVQGFAVAPRVVVRTAASLHSGSPPRVVDATPQRLDLPLKREHSRLDLPFVPPDWRPRVARVSGAQHDAPALGPGLARSADLRISHFRRRIPRMNSEDPPCA